MREEKGAGTAIRLSKLILLFLPFIAACNSTVFHKYANLDDEVWNISDTLSYSFNASALKHDKGDFSLRMEVRATAAYSLKYLVMRVEAFASCDTMPIVVDTVMCEIYDDNGRRRGSTAGVFYQIESDVRNIGQLAGDTLLFKVSHIMDNASLYGIADVGLKLMYRR